jgi:predicted ATP-dependent serine protease
MHKCKNCGTEVERIAPVCPSCGEAPGAAETITDLPKANVKEADKKLKAETGGARPLRDHYAEAGGAETITDLPKLHLREAHKKLKEEIKEAREREKE